MIIQTQMPFPAYVLYQTLAQEYAKCILEQAAAVLVRARTPWASEDWSGHHCGITMSLLHLRAGYTNIFQAILHGITLRT